MEYLFEGYRLGREAGGDIVLQGLYDAFSEVFSMLLQGGVMSTLIGALVLIGLIVIVIRGLWKVLLLPIGRLLFD